MWTVSRKRYLPNTRFRREQAKMTKATTQRPNRKRFEKYDQAKHWFPSLPFQQFQVLFNSLFKVLCIFPSRYLYAIGLPPIFSFRWNLPPTLSCNPKQLDSSNTLLIPCQTGVSPSMLPYSKGLRLGLLSNEFISTTRRKVTKLLHRFTRWAIPASLAVTRGILVSFFSSA